MARPHDDGALPESLGRALSRPDITPVPLSEVRGLEVAARSTNSSRPPWTGTVLAGPPPLVLIPCIRSRNASRAAETFFPWVWPTQFGPVLTITYANPRVVGRAYAWNDDAVMREIVARGARCVLTVNGRPEYAADVRWDEEGSRYLADAFTDANIVLRDPPAALWCTLREFEKAATPLPEMSTSNQLSMGWSERYSLYVQGLRDALRDVSAEPVSSQPLPVPAPLPRDVVDVAAQGKAGVGALVSRMEELVRDLKPMQLLGSIRTMHADCAISAALRAALEMAVEVSLLSSRSTEEGARLPLLSHSGDLTFLRIEPHNLPPSCPPRRYWMRHLDFPQYGLERAVSGADAPVDWTREGALESLPTADDVSGTSLQADLLLDEAREHKQWTIPSGALVKLPYGPFSCCEIYEAEHEYTFLFRTPEGEYCLGFLVPEAHDAVFDAVHWLAPDKETLRTQIESAAKLVMAAIVRDFSVVEVRESVLEPQPISSSWPAPSARVHGSPRIIYLPRVKYVNLAHPDIPRAAADLGHVGRTAHEVAAHFRRVAHPSPAQLALATRYGLSVPEGHTFVRPHRRGDEARAAVYRSRSALQSLYAASSSPALAQGHDRWFQFERDVRGLMAALGFRVEHVSAPGRGDQGVDLIAVKGRDLDEVVWIIQCKCYGPKHKVGPDIVRELLGTLQDFPQGSRGMIVTTSTFSYDARGLAEKHGIRLIDGAEFLERIASSAAALGTARPT